MTNSFSLSAGRFPLLTGPVDPSNTVDNTNQLLEVLNTLPAIIYPARNLQVTGSTLTVSAANDQQTLVQNRAAGCTITLPASSGSGLRFKVFVQTTITSNGLIINTAGSDVFVGGILVAKTSDGTSFAGDSTANKTITLNGTTTGGIAGSVVELQDVYVGGWAVTGYAPGSGTIATPFSN
jgi:hypothetical protein